MGKAKDLTGMRFGRLTVLGFSGRNKHGHPLWACECDCGTVKSILASSLLKGASTSCGCYHKEQLSELASVRNKKHGASATRLYRIWHGMKNRCDNPNSDAYSYYGKEGKFVCAEWHTNFQVFYDWAIENGYRDDLTIDRIDNDKGYSPGNCRWVTMKEQSNNRRNNKQITFNGKTQTVAMWAEETGMSVDVLKWRINKAKWSIEKALTTPVRKVR